MKEKEPNNHEQLIEEIYKIRDEVMKKNKHTGITSRVVLEAIVQMFEKVLPKNENN